MTARPNLALVVGPGMTPTAIAEMADMELAVQRDEAEAHVRRMRLVMQLPLWNAELYAPVRKLVMAEVERFARKVENDGAAA